MNLRYRPFPIRPSNHPIPAQNFEQIAQTRRPTFNAAGGFRGFRSTPGATSSSRNAGFGTGGEFAMRTDGNTGFTNDSDWKNFFHSNTASNTSQPPAVGSSVPYTPAPVNYDVVGDPATQANRIPGLDAPPEVASATPDASGYLSNVISSSQDWMKQNFGDMYG